MINKFQVQRAWSLILRIIRKLWRISALIMSLPIVLILVLLFPVYKIKLLRLFSDRIGHYSTNTELLLRYLDSLEEKRTKYFFYISEAPLSNTQLHRMWKRVIPIIPCPNLASYIDCFMLYIFGRKYKDDMMKKFETSDGCCDSDGSFQKFLPYLYFTRREIQLGTKLLTALGIPLGARWVCILVRDSGYLARHFPNQDWSHHFHRNANIQNYSKAALFLAEKGYYVLRMGKSVSQPFNVSHPNIIDYAKHPLQSDFGDLYLSATCAFFISTGTGLDAFVQGFRKPILFVNYAPFYHQLTHWYPCRLFIFKKILDKKSGQFVLFKDVDKAMSTENNVKKMLEKFNWEIVENNEDEILEAVREMENHFDKEPEKSLENPFHAFLKTSMQLLMLADRESLRIYPEKFYIRVCSKFFEQSKWLFSE